MINDNTVTRLCHNLSDATLGAGEGVLSRNLDCYIAPPPASTWNRHWTSCGCCDSDVGPRGLEYVHAVAPVDRYTHAARSCLRPFMQASYSASLKLRPCGARNSMPHPHGAETLSVYDHCLSVCPFVCPIPDPKSRTEGVAS